MNEFFVAKTDKEMNKIADCLEYNGYSVFVLLDDVDEAYRWKVYYWKDDDEKEGE